jgi:hypothetical protein
MIIREQGAVITNKIKQTGHLLQIRRHVRVIASKVGVIELDVDHMLDFIVFRSKTAGTTVSMAPLIALVALL